jgi:simple sugar transport system substrate-binding protein
MNVQCDFVGTEGIDLEAQADMVRQAVADGYDGIAINLIDQTAFDEVVQQTIDRGVPVVGFNTDDHGTPNARLSCVNQQLEEAGRKLAEHVLADLPEGAHVLLTVHDEGVSSLEDRLRGLQSVLRKGNARWTVIVSGNDAVKGTEVVARALREHPDIRVILGTGQADTEAAGRAIRNYFPDQGYWAAGFDLSPTTLQLIQDGVIRCTVDQQPYIQGFYPVVQLTLYLRYGILPSDIDAGAGIIDRSNVEQVMRLSQQNYR